MTGRSTQPREAQRESGRCELLWTNCGSSPRAVNQTAYPVWSTRPERTCQVGFNVSSTLQEHSISVLTKCRARLRIQVVPRKHFRPGQTSPGRFLLYLYIRVKKSFVLALICHIKPAAPHSAESAQRHSAPCIGQHTAQKFICFVCICRSRVYLGAWKSALFRKISLSERSEFEIFLNAFSRFSDT